MDLVITDENISQYEQGVFPNITSINWKVNKLNGHILSNFPNLTKLKCENIGITTLLAIGHLTSLEYVDCSMNKLSTLNGLKDCVNLKYLKCYGNKITNLKALRKCSKLVELNCSYNRLKTLEGLAPSLKIIDCNFNDLVRICSVGDQLIAINVSDNKLSSLDGIEKCVNLQELYCSNNKLESLGGLKNCKELKVLYCDFNKLNSLHDLEKCTQLQTLICEHNDLITLDLETNTRLQILDCSQNNLIHLQGLKNCRELFWLNCELNQLTSLHGLENSLLYELYCSDNKLKNLIPITTTSVRAVYDYNDYEPITDQEQSLLDRLDMCQDNSSYVQFIICDDIQDSVRDEILDLINNGNKPNQLAKDYILAYFHDKTPYHSLSSELFKYVCQCIKNYRDKERIRQIFEDYKLLKQPSVWNYQNFEIKIIAINRLLFAIIKIVNILCRGS